MFNRLRDLAASNPAAHLLALTVDGKPFAARDGDSVAATLLAAGLPDCRSTPVSGSARGPFCMMGVCFDCLVVIDGQPNQQGCMIPAREGMKIERQQGAPAVVIAPDTSSTPGAAGPGEKP